MSCGCGCLGPGCLNLGKTKEEFQGLPYDSNTYYAAGLAGKADAVKAEFERAILDGGILGIRFVRKQIRMKELFSEWRDYMEVGYGGVTAYILVSAFGKDLFASWISFFHLGCLQRAMRFFKAEPTDLDVDDLNMIGQDIDLCIKTTLDKVLRGEGVGKEQVQKIFKRSKRKKFVKA